MSDSNNPAPVNDGSNDTPVSAKDKVPLKEKLAYGAGGVAMGVQERFDNQVINPIFVIGAGIAPQLMSVIGMFYRLWDAVTDMAMGVISDNTRTRWGRRRPFMFVGAILMGLAMPWLFFYDPSWDVSKITIWMVGFSLLLYLTLTIYNVPYQCMLVECTPDTNERTNVGAWRSFVGIATGVMVSWTWRLAQAEPFHVNGEPDVLHGIRWLVCLMIVPVVLMGVLPAIFMKERFYQVASKQKSISLKNALKFTMGNKAFRILLIFTLVFIGGTQMHWSLVFYVKLFYVCGGDQVLASQIAGWQGTLQALIAVIGIPLAQYLARKIGKAPTLALGMGCSFAAYVMTYFMMTPEMPYLSIVPFVMMGPATSMIWIMIPSMTGDVIDYDEWKNGERAEGSYTAVYSWTVKLAQTVSVLSGFLVAWAGYRPEIRDELAQHTDVLNNMRLMLTGIPSTFLFIAILCLLLYPLKAKLVQEIRRDLESRRGTV